ncbi:hypothetical protein [Pseudomonas sp.]|jgi:hypothetical protein|uniref:hypothetical protein n=1 Tax=Pseudomonas sp. TaxID=306 RepID=UPI002ED87458
MDFFVSVSGYEGQPTTIVGGLDEETNILVIAGRMKTFQTARIKGREDISVVSNLGLPDVDFQFRDEHMREAIIAYQNRTLLNTITLDPALKQLDPRSVFEKDDIKEGKQTYRILPTISNGQLAVLIACGFCELQARIMSAQVSLDEMNDLYDAGGESDLYDAYTI